MRIMYGSNLKDPPTHPKSSKVITRTEKEILRAPEQTNSLIPEITMKNDSGVLCLVKWLICLYSMRLVRRRRPGWRRILGLPSWHTALNLRRRRLYLLRMYTRTRDSTQIARLLRLKIGTDAAQWRGISVIVAGRWSRNLLHQRSCLWFVYRRSSQACMSNNCEDRWRHLRTESMFKEKLRLVSRVQLVPSR